MKILFSLFFLILGLNSIAQKKTNISIDNSEFTCEKVQYNSEQNEIVMLGNVSFKTEIIELENAETIVYHKETNEIVVSGLKEFKFDGTLEITNSAGNKKLRYKIGDKIAYVE